MCATHQTAIREPGAVGKNFVPGKIKYANSKSHKISELKCALNVLDWAFLVKSAEWFAMLPNTRGSGLSRLSNLR